MDPYGRFRVHKSAWTIPVSLAKQAEKVGMHFGEQPSVLPPQPVKPGLFEVGVVLALIMSSKWALTGSFCFQAMVDAAKEKSENGKGRGRGKGKARGKGRGRGRGKKS